MGAVPDPRQAARWHCGTGKTGKKGSDKGIDGIINFVDDNSRRPKRVLVQVKSGKVKSGDIRDLRGTVEREDPTPSRRGRWRQKTIRDIVLDDCYKPFTHAEIAALVSPEVAARLDPEEDYGLVYYGRRRVETEQVSEPDGNGGRRYRRAHQEEWVPKEDCIPIPVVSSRVPRALVDEARDTLKDNRKTFSKGDRLYELSGGVFVCGG